MVLNADNCCFLTLGFTEPFPDYFSPILTEEKFLGIVDDNKLNF